MNQEVYSLLELDPDGLGRFADRDEDAMLGSFLDYLAESVAPAGREAREIEAFLRQRQSHILNRISLR